MADNEATEVVEEEVTPEVPEYRIVSPEWPRDPFAFTSALRREIARAVGRVKGNDEKHAIFMEHLRAAAKWGVERLAVHKGLQASAFAEAEQRAAAAQEVADAAAAVAEARQPQETPAEAAMRQANAGVGGATVAKKG